LVQRVEFAARQQHAIWALWRQGSGTDYFLSSSEDSCWFCWLIRCVGSDPFDKIEFVHARSDGAVATILEHPKEFADLENLCFQSGVTDRGLERLAEFNGFKRLRCANFLSTPMTDAGMKRVAGWVNLQHLMLSGCPSITDAGLAHLADLPALESLYLCSDGTPKMSIGDAGLVHVGRMRQLQCLYVRGLPISDAGLAPLQGLEHLERLIICGARITDAGLRHLEGTNIKTLALFDADISDAGLEHLAKMRQLEWLGLRNTKVTPVGLREFQRHLPRCRVESD
jgi:hypothetical protein